MWKERRKVLNLSQHDLARIAGVSPRTIQRHEAGRNSNPAISRLIDQTLRRLARQSVRGSFLDSLDDN